MDVGSVDLTFFFLQNEADEDNEPIIIKITGSVLLLLVECDPGK